MQVLANQSDSKARIRILELVQELSVFFPSEGVLIWDAKSKGFLIDILNELEASSDALSMYGFLNSVREIKQEVVNLPVGQPGEQIAQLSHLKLRLKGLKLELSQAIQGKEAQQDRKSLEAVQSAQATPAPKAEEPIDDNDIAAKLAELKRKYAESLEQRLNEIVELWEQFKNGDYDEEQVLGLLNRFHKLAGNAASFGYQELGEQAADLNNHFKRIRESGTRPDDSAIATISQAISRLLDLGNVARPELSAGLTGTQPEEEQQQEQQPESRSQQLLYLVDDDTSLAQFLSLQLEHQGYAVRLLSSPDQLGEAIAENPPALVLMDISFPEGETAGIDVINKLRKNQRLRQPVIFLSHKHDLQTRMAAARARADGFFSKPVDVGQLVDSIYNLTNMGQTRERHVAVLHESPDSSKRFCARLANLGMQASCVETPEQLLNMLDESGTDILVLSNTAGGLNGIDLATMLHQQYQYQNLPIILLDSDNVQLDQLDLLGNVRSFRESSDDRLLIELIETISQRQLRLRQTAKEAARKDELTGLHSRSHFMQLLELLQASAKLDDKHFDLMLIKVNDFESINARLGIDAGDAVIRETANILRDTCESTDLIARLGDDEFCLVTSDDAAIDEKAEQIRSAIRDHAFSFNNETLPIDVTFGMSRIDARSGAHAAISEAMGVIYRSRHEESAATKQAPATSAEQQQKPPVAAPAPEAETEQQTTGEQRKPVMEASSLPAATENPVEKAPPKPAAAPAKPPESPKASEKIREASMRYQAVVSLHGGNGEHYSASLCISTSSGSELSVDDYLNDFGHPAMAHPLIHRTIDMALSDIKNRKQPPPTLFIDLPESCVLDARLAVWIANRFKKENFQNNPFVFLLHEKSLLNPVPGLNHYLKALTTAGSRVGIHSVSSEKPLQAALSLGKFSFLRLHRKMLSGHGSRASNLMNGILQLAHKNNLQVIGCGVESPEILTFSWSSQLDFVQGNFIHKPAGVMNFEFMKFQ